MSDTASEIRQRISPENIKAEVSDYVRSRGERMLTDITEAARRNPMQAVAVGASVAYPLLRLAKSIPLPILMVGAGLFFAGSSLANRLLKRRPIWHPTCRTNLAGAATIFPIKSLRR